MLLDRRAADNPAGAAGTWRLTQQGGGCLRGGHAAHSQGGQPRGVHCHPGRVPRRPGSGLRVAGVELLLQQGWWAGLSTTPVACIVSVRQ